MTQPFLGQIQPFGFGFAPRGWAQCNGQLLPISQNTALFSLLGTFYGGNGQTNFALPDLQSRVPMHKGNFFFQGEEAGEESITLLMTEMPLHNHTFSGASLAANFKVPVDGSAFAKSNPNASHAYYAADNASLTIINPATVSLVGGNLPHTNLQPYLTINWCIAMQGIFPSRN
jgi:microcystin-dependent protein